MMSAAHAVLFVSVIGVTLIAVGVDSSAAHRMRSG